MLILLFKSIKQPRYNHVVSFISIKKLCFAVWEMRYAECLSHCRRHVTQRPWQSQLVNRPDRLVTGTAAGN